MPTIRMLKASRQRVSLLQREKADRLIEALPEHMKPIVRLALATGCRASIEDFRFHDLRHTWASWHVQSGTSLQELVELGGWKSYEMEPRYVHLAPERLSSVARRIEQQSDRAFTVTPPIENVAANATFSLQSVH